MKGLLTALTIVFIVKLLYAVIVPMESPNDYQECLSVDELYRLVHRGYCYYVAASNISIKQVDAKATKCGSKGRLALPYSPTIVDFIKNRLGSFHELTSAVKAWIGLEQKLDQDTPDAGWYYEGRPGETSTIDSALFFFEGNGACGFSVPERCVAEFKYRDQTYTGCTRVDEPHCWCSTGYIVTDYNFLYCGHDEEIVLGSDCLTGGACGNDTDCTYDWITGYDCNCPAAGADENKNGCFKPQNGVSDGRNGTEKNRHQLAIITQQGNILEAAELHQYHYAVCQYKDENGLLRYEHNGFKMRNAISASMNDIKNVEKCAIKCHQSWACAAISYSATQKLCLLHSISSSHTKAIVVQDAEFSIWDHGL